MKSIYIAGPMFNEAELTFNAKLADLLEGMGHEVFLPQRAGYIMSDLLKEMTVKEASELIFTKDFENIKAHDIFLFVLDGRVPDEGACVALGLAYASGKICMGLKTDSRSAMDGNNNPMIEGSILQIVHSLNELLIKLKEME